MRSVHGNFMIQFKSPLHREYNVGASILCRAMQEFNLLVAVLPCFGCEIHISINSVVLAVGMQAAHELCRPIRVPMIRVLVIIFRKKRFFKWFW